MIKPEFYSFTISIFFILKIAVIIDQLTSLKVNRFFILLMISKIALK